MLRACDWCGSWCDCGVCDDPKAMAESEAVDNPMEAPHTCVLEGAPVFLEGHGSPKAKALWALTQLTHWAGNEVLKVTEGEPQ